MELLFLHPHTDSIFRLINFFKKSIRLFVKLSALNVIVKGQRHDTWNELDVVWCDRSKLRDGVPASHQF